VKKLLNIAQMFIENSFKSKLKSIGEFLHSFGIVEKPSMRRFNEGDLEKNYLRCERY
jgi:hypothetical protein